MSGNRNGPDFHRGGTEAQRAGVTCWPQAEGFRASGLQAPAPAAVLAHVRTSGRWDGSHCGQGRMNAPARCLGCVRSTSARLNSHPYRTREVLAAVWRVGTRSTHSDVSKRLPGFPTTVLLAFDPHAAGGVGLSLASCPWDLVWTEGGSGAAVEKPGAGPSRILWPSLKNSSLILF